jgi:N-methylhydantoinase B/oxoprolinase/acetone carboxylase alpha subunit
MYLVSITGGYGAPCERPRELVEPDLRRGYVSVEAANGITVRKSI